MKKMFNFDYFNIWKEIGYFYLVKAVFRKEKINVCEKRILIINPCIIGDFAASVPAIADFIQRNKDKKIDLIVSAPLKTLAEKIKGIEKVYTTQSVSKISYEKIILLRATGEVYDFLKKVSACGVQTNGWTFIWYAFHLLMSLLLRRAPKQWRVVNFEMLGGAPRNISFDEMFKLGPEDYKSANKVIIHTGASWPMMHWEKEKWVELLRKINTFGTFEFIFVGAAKDSEDYEYISSNLPFEIHSVISKIDLLELMLLLRSADYFIGIDSGPANLAHLAKLRSIVIFGPGPHMFVSDDTNDIIIDKSNGRGLYQRFFLKKKGFIQMISSEEVFQAFIKLYRK
ncbi:MAG: glycosyltransferase family 9 protein [Candidatus Azambacteria bacterium]|nr:glycosyltransferase family 9 protein [Candidatus Azambacteria bacterium]